MLLELLFSKTVGKHFAPLVKELFFSLTDLARVQLVFACQLIDTFVPLDCLNSNGKLELRYVRNSFGGHIGPLHFVSVFIRRISGLIGGTDFGPHYKHR